MFSKLIRFITIAAAICGIVFIFKFQKEQAARKLPPANEPPLPPTARPFPHAVAATGIIEALSDNVAIGVPAPGLVTQMYVKVNDVVKKDTPLFQLDERDLRAEQITIKAQQATTAAQIRVSEAQVKKLQSILSRLESISDSRAISAMDLDNARQDVNVAQAQLQAAQASSQAADAALKRTEDLIARLTIRAPRDGTILQVNLRAGEYASTSPKQAAMILGDLEKFQIRADVDEQSAIRIQSGQRGEAQLKGNPKITFPLEFVRIEPYIVPKVSLTGASTERVDTRVLQVIFSFQKPQAANVYVGQQVDLFIETKE